MVQLDRRPLNVHQRKLARRSLPTCTCTFPACEWILISLYGNHNSCFHGTCTPELSYNYALSTFLSIRLHLQTAITWPFSRVGNGDKVWPRILASGCIFLLKFSLAIACFHTCTYMCMHIEQEVQIYNLYHVHVWKGGCSTLYIVPPTILLQTPKLIQVNIQCTFPFPCHQLMRSYSLIRVYTYIYM